MNELVTLFFRAPSLPPACPFVISGQPVLMHLSYNKSLASLFFSWRLTFVSHSCMKLHHNQVNIVTVSNGGRSISLRTYSLREEQVILFLSPWVHRVYLIQPPPTWPQTDYVVIWKRLVPFVILFLPLKLSYADNSDQTETNALIWQLKENNLK